MLRATSLNLLASRTTSWDIAIIGGGATGMGIALDAASRGYATCLLEQADFGKGTSSRATKLVHGGVRYLQQGNISLVTEALHERGILRQNAPHLVHDLPFIVPTYALWEAPFYGIGLKVYDLLAGQYGFGKSRHLSKAEVLTHIPTLETEGLRGGILYYDGQFDDARLLIDLAHTATAHGAALLNYAPVTALARNSSGRLTGLAFRDLESDTTHHIQAKCIINAAGPFVDAIRAMDQPKSPLIIAPSQGVHIVFDRSFLPGDAAIMVPRTSDKRVMFAIPWHNHTLVGTTDTPIESPTLEPTAREEEIHFLLETAGRYLHKHPTRADILSLFTGIRPLVRSHATSGAGSGTNSGTGVPPVVGHTVPPADRTASISRDHHLDISPAGLITITGGKWTTYRRMAEDAVNHAATVADLGHAPCKTKNLPIQGIRGTGVPPAVVEPLKSFAVDSTFDIQHSTFSTPFHPALPITPADILHAARHEMARTLEDALARRTRGLFLNTAATLSIAPAAAAIMAAELQKDHRWQIEQITAFTALARNYQPA